MGILRNIATRVVNFALGTADVWAADPISATRVAVSVRGEGKSMNVTGMISELRRELEGIEREIFLLERLGTRGNVPVVQSIVETDGAATGPAKPESHYFG